MNEPNRTVPRLSEEQSDAASRILDFTQNGKPGAYFVMHGYAGSGKTTVLGSVAKAVPSALLCTLTGKAADVLRRKTGSACDTIHSTFYDLQEVWKRDDGTEAMNFRPRWNEDDLWGRTVLVDEVSMVSEDMARDMLRTGCKIVAVGDPGQLPPVVGAQFFTKPDVTLKKIHRQALDSPIIRQAHMVRLGRGYAPDTQDFRVVRKPTPDEVRDADVILCWRNVTRHACNAKMRCVRGFLKDHPQVGEPILCLKNAPEFNIYNGGVYTLLEDFVDGSDSIRLDVGGREILIRDVIFEGMRDAVPPDTRPVSKFSFGYALTCHKAQGSEFPRVLLFDEYTMDENRNQWLYTAITRATQAITVVKP